MRSFFKPLGTQKPQQKPESGCRSWGGSRFTGVLLIHRVRVQAMRPEWRRRHRMPWSGSVGKANAPITVIEYASMTCSALCGPFQPKVMPQFKTELD